MTNPKVLTGAIILAVLLLVAVFGPLVTETMLGLSPTRLHVGANLEPPSARHWLGTTSSGQDVFVQLIAGTRVSVFVGLVAGVISTFLAVLFGMLSGFHTGKLGGALTVFVNIFLVIPGLPLLLMIASYTKGRGGWIAVALIIGLTSWAGGARVKRAQTLTLRQRDFVAAARNSGDSVLRILFVEIVPHLAPVIASTFLFSVVGSIAAEAGLDFIGAGNTNVTSWGTMLFWAQAQGAMLGGAWWWFVPPGLCIVLVGAAAGLMNFGIDELSDPRRRRQRAVESSPRVTAPRTTAVEVKA